MKIHRENLGDAQRMHSEAIVVRHVRELFRLLPGLSGFRLSLDFTLADVCACSSPDCDSTRGLYPLVMQSIVELAECHPEAVQLMRGRTFARRLH